jgi:hypothetical protein
MQNIHITNLFKKKNKRKLTNKVTKSLAKIKKKNLNILEFKYLFSIKLINSTIKTSRIT